MFAHNKDVLTKYKNLVVKMCDDMVENAFGKNNYEHLCGYDIILGLTCVLGSAKFVQVGPWQRYFCLRFGDLCHYVLKIYLLCTQTH